MLNAVPKCSSHVLCGRWTDSFSIYTQALSSTTNKHVPQYILVIIIYLLSCCSLDALAALTVSVQLITALLTVVGSGLSLLVCDTDANSGLISRQLKLCCLALEHILLDKGWSSSENCGDLLRFLVDCFFTQFFLTILFRQKQLEESAPYRVLGQNIPPFISLNWLSCWAVTKLRYSHCASFSSFAQCSISIVINSVSFLDKDIS